MRTDDPVILAQIRQIEGACEALRRICGFEPRNATPETYASRKYTHDCPVDGCTVSCRSHSDLEAHVETMHNRPLLEVVA